MFLLIVINLNFNMMTKKLCLILTILFSVSCSRVEVKNLREGNVVFIESKSSQSPYIKKGTMCKWTHCGVVVNTAGGLRVLEASNTVTLTPINAFIGKAKNGKYMAKRPRRRLPKPISYSKWLGQPYDKAFKFDNGRMYCSELVWLVYKEQGIELCKPRKVGSYIVVKLSHSKLASKHKEAKMLRNLLQARKIKLDQYTVAPSDLARAI